MILLRTAIFALAALSIQAGVARAEMRLAMFEEAWCNWCEQWNADIAGVYPKTGEGKSAPLWRIDIHDDLPDGLDLATRVNYTPTFVLLDDGREIGRIEGYPGEDFFWGLLNQLLERAERQRVQG